MTINKDQIKGRVNEAAGEVQEQAGKLINSPEQQAKGHAREQAGKVQKNYGDMKDTVTDAKEDLKDELRKP
jgi:uncharacterized protein YjbJ (UPF0337 family)